MEDVETKPLVETGIEKMFKDLHEIGKDYYDLTTGEVVRVIPVDNEKYADRIELIYEDEDSWIPTRVKYKYYYIKTISGESPLHWFSHMIRRGENIRLVNSWGFNSELYTLVSDVKPNPETGIFTVRCGACGSKNITCNNLEIKCCICGNRKALV